MSKYFSLKITYKELCILKHALRDKVADNERLMPMVVGVIGCQDFDEEFKEEQRKKLKEFREEEKTLANITKQVERVQNYIGKAKHLTNK